MFNYKGKKYGFNYQQDEKTVDLVFNEVFVQQDYKEGLHYIRKINKPIVLDVGAYIGISTLYFKQKKDAIIYAVEPNPFSYKNLVLNIEPFDTIYPVNTSLGCATQERELVVPKNGGTAMSFYDKGDQAFHVYAFAIDEFFKRYNITHVDLLKIDVEGAEYEIFLSDGFASVADKIDMIIGEAHDIPIYHSMLGEILKRNQFKLVWKPDLNHLNKIDYQLGELRGHLEAKVNTLFIAKR